MTTITHTEIKYIEPNNGLIAFANITINENLNLNNIAIYLRVENQNVSKYRLVYPTRKVGSQNQYLFQQKIKH